MPLHDWAIGESSDADREILRVGMRDAPHLRAALTSRRRRDGRARGAHASAGVLSMRVTVRTATRPRMQARKR
jgi:hypothetical protein